MPISDVAFHRFNEIAQFHGMDAEQVIRYFLTVLDYTDDASWPTVTAPYGSFANLQSCTVVIPTFNSAPWIGAFLQVYRESGIEPLFAIDSRTTDGTESVLAGLNARFIAVASVSPRVESLFPAIVASTSTPWILRMDDDELPSGALLQWLNELELDCTEGNVDLYGFSRSHLMLDNAGRLHRSRMIAFGQNADFDRQWRLFRGRKVSFDERLHTPGLVVRHEARAPDAAMILHFDWIIRSREARSRKVQVYQTQNASADRWKHFTLWEDIPCAWHRFDEVQSELLAAFARAIKGKGDV